MPLRWQVKVHGWDQGQGSEVSSVYWAAPVFVYSIKGKYCEMLNGKFSIVEHHSER